jgi:ATP-dependent DNA helicase RecG
LPGRRLAQLTQIKVAELKTVGPKRAAALAGLEIETVYDLLTHYPRRVVDRTHQQQIGALSEGEEAVVTAEVVSSKSRRLHNRKSLAEIVVADSSGTLVCTFFNQPWRAKQFSEGQVVTVFGKATYYRGRRQMANPVVDLVGDQTGRVVPIYPQSAKAAVSSVQLTGYVKEALERAGEFAEPVPARFLQRLELMGRTEAFRGRHQPETTEQFDLARHRLVFDELLRLQLLLVSRRRATAEAAKGIAHVVSGHLLTDFETGLPFELTGAQKRAIAAIRADLEAAHPMNRLLQGDVGAGKTVVALAALLVGVEGGYQGAFMVPTEVLAEQHHLSARRLLSGLSLRDESRLGSRRPLGVALLTNKTPGAERTRILSELGAGSLDLVIGTHALIAEGVEFANLGVVVVDEQHRFGVEQRAQLREKAAADPDLLVMTATPIPRTAAMTVYGDLDHTILDELPAGRAEIESRWLVGERQEETAWKKVRAEVAAGHQAYVVCPLIGSGLSGEGEEPEDPEHEDELDEAEDSGRETLLETALEKDRPPRAATEELERLVAGPLSGVRLGLLHGQMPPREKEAVMAGFRRGEIDVLVATTVVEVGVDVANATVMVIEDADRFGIAQLHQLRGRVGRSELASYCYFLTTGVITENSKRRLEALVRTRDGFELAEEDLELRGGGTVLGARQKGRSDLKLADLRRDRAHVRAARQVAEEIVAEAPDLGGEYALLKEEVTALVSKEEAAFLFRS